MLLPEYSETHRKAEQKFYKNKIHNILIFQQVI